jgi:hypothetical protein
MLRAVAACQEHKARAAMAARLIVRGLREGKLKR